MIIHKKYPSTKKLWRGKFIYMLIRKSITKGSS